MPRELAVFLQDSKVVGVIITWWGGEIISGGG